MTTEILNSNFDLNNIKYPKNIYALRICDEKGNIYDISVSHNGFCPNIKTEREQSNFNDYLSNLEYSIVSAFFKSIKKKKPKTYYNKIEVITDLNGKIYHLSKAINQMKSFAEIDLENNGNYLRLLSAVSKLSCLFS